jgi:hypothetical protein
MYFLFQLAVIVIGAVLALWTLMALIALTAVGSSPHVSYVPQGPTKPAWTREDYQHCGIGFLGLGVTGGEIWLLVNTPVIGVAAVIAGALAFCYWLWRWS